MSAILRALEGWFVEGFCEMGEVAFSERGGGFLLHHVEDCGAENLIPYFGPEAAREIARYDGAGKYRPLRTEPNLRRGWRLEVLGWDGLRRALDGFYPAALGVLLAWREGRAKPVPLRETLGRQTGMYKFAGSISDAGADRMVEGRCASAGDAGGCVRKILWDLDAGHPLAGLAPGEKDVDAPPYGFSAGRIPVLCLEACNLLVAEARKISRAEFQAKAAKGDG